MLSKVTNSLNFRGGLNNKYLLKTLEGISNHPATFVAGTTLFMSNIVRPIAISITPNTDKENKKYAAIDSVSSGLIKFALAEAIAIPIENAIKQIDKNPEEFLKKQTIENLKETSKTINDSRAYKFASQLIKQSTSLLSAIPKSVISVALIPVFAKLFSNHKTSTKKHTEPTLIKNNDNPNFNAFYNKINFKGLNQKITNGVSNIFNAESFQKFVKKHSGEDKNITRNISCLTDALLAGTFAITTKKSKKIDEDKKNPLILNKLISTALILLLGCQIDKFAQAGSRKLIEKFTQKNLNDPKLSKYIQGINILRPTLIFAVLYYGILPMLSVNLADKADKFIKNKCSQNGKK